MFVRVLTFLMVVFIKVKKKKVVVFVRVVMFFRV